MTQSHSHSPLSSLTSKDPTVVPAKMSLDLIYFGTRNRNLTALHVRCCAVLTRKVLLGSYPDICSFILCRTEPHKRLAPDCQPGLRFPAALPAAEPQLLQQTEPAPRALGGACLDLFVPLVMSELRVIKRTSEISRGGICLHTGRWGLSSGRVGGE